MRNRMQKLIGGLFTAAWIASLPLIAYADAVILHTNDVHCGVAKNIHIAAVTQYKYDLQKENPEVILVDAGDAVQGEPLGSLSRGAALIRIMNRADYDFAIPGNHEYDFGMDRFLELASQSSAATIAAISSTRGRISLYSRHIRSSRSTAKESH